jgi:hypothetical protein
MGSAEHYVLPAAACVRSVAWYFFAFFTHARSSFTHSGHKSSRMGGSSLPNVSPSFVLGGPEFTKNPLFVSEINVQHRSHRSL